MTTRAAIIKMAQKCGFRTFIEPVALERFHAPAVAAERDRIADEARHIIKRAEARGAAAEREACAKICEERANGENDAQWCTDAIRARSNS